MIRLFFLLLFLLFNTTYSQRTNYDPFIIPYEIFEGQDVQISFYAGTGVKHAHSFNSSGEQRNPLQVWSFSENAVTMLNDSPPGSEQEMIRNQIGILTNPDSGKIIFHGRLKEKFASDFGLRKHLFDYFHFSLLIPYYAFSLEEVSYQDLTPTNTLQDQLIHQLITNNLVSNVKKWGNLDLTPWSRDGFGDMTASLEWHKHFPQYRPLLKEVVAHLHAGLTFPTGKRNDQDKLIAFSFGNNGAFSIPFGAYLDLRFGEYVHGGFDVLLIHRFSTVDSQRIRVSPTQTQLLLLNVAETYFNFGLTQRFLLYVKVADAIPHVSFAAVYHYLKQGEDEIVVRGNQFLTNIAQNAHIFDDRTVHHFIGTLEYHQSFSDFDFSISLVGRYPFKGKRFIASPTLGGSISFAF